MGLFGANVTYAAEVRLPYGARGRWDVLVVQTPGVRDEGVHTLTQALRRRGAAVRVLRFACTDGGVHAQAAHVASAIRSLGPWGVVVAHGVGAVPAIVGSLEVEAAGLVLLAPVLDVWPVAALDFLASLPLGDEVALDVPRAWGERVLHDVLLGAADVPLGCVDPTLAAEIQGWIRAGVVPLPLTSITHPTWIGVSVGDHVASVEAVIPASRRIATREVVRFGLGRLDHQDFGHAELLTHRVPTRAAARAARRLHGASR